MGIELIRLTKHRFSIVIQQIKQNLQKKDYMKVWSKKYQTKHLKKANF